MLISSVLYNQSVIVCSIYAGVYQSIAPDSMLTNCDSLVGEYLLLKTHDSGSNSGM